MSLAARALRWLDLRAPAQPLAETRIAIGLCGYAVVWEASRSVARILAPDVPALPFVAWLPRLSPATLPLLRWVWLAAISAFVFGFKTRLAGAVVTCLSAYVLILDERTYSNHLYLFVLIMLLLTVADSGAAFSIDALRTGRRETVAAWPIYLLKIQASVVYGFSAVAKLTSPSFLSGEVLSQTLRNQGWLVVPAAWRTPMWMGALSATAIALELFIAVGLWNRRLRWPAAAGGVMLHAFIMTMLDSSRLALGIFAWELLALYPLFFQRPNGNDHRSSDRASGAAAG